ncbi:hypothetical protein ITP53_24255 [Nonomuraea sp. K274]|uniref:Uncharacterized protein n=1 Tax=Nonomuraea cypriaca TaxID=1187855 RepID=A0A931AC13_9ACTN|nr:hypothetical protein [Nonomuraea cypriaca]MBF8188790.1 hypothetical protein [Nonomuraea cypriaca]
MDEIVESGWREFVAREFGTVTAQEERGVAEMVIDEPNRHQWRVVDAAYDRFTCTECGNRLSRGPAGCDACDLANGFRYVAIEIDRPGVPAGNEHALRVNVSVVRRPSWVSWREMLGRRLLLPLLLDGHVPTTREAQSARALLNKAGTAEELTELIYSTWRRDGHI